MKMPKDFERCTEINILNKTSTPVCSSKFKDFAESIIVYSFYMDFLFLALVWVYILFESVSIKAVTVHNFTQTWEIDP